MGIDWIDDLLQKAEGVPLIGGAVHDLRYAYEVWRKDPVDPNVVQPQAQNLSDLHTRALSLLQQYNASLPTLRQNWSGKRATQYFTGGQSGSGIQLGDNLFAYSSILSYNQTAHQHAIKKLQNIQSLHGQLDFQVNLAAGTLAVMVGEDVIPLFGEAADAAETPILIGEAADAASLATDTETAIAAVESAEEVGQATEFAEEGLDTSETLGDLGGEGGDIPPSSPGPTWTPLKVVAFAVTALGVASMIADITLAAFTPPQPPIASNQPPTNQTQFERDLNQLVLEFGEEWRADISALLKAGYSPDEIRAMLNAGFSHAQIAAIINRTKQAQRNGTDNLGLTVAQIHDLVARVAAACNSPDKDTQLEGRVARALIGDLVSFRRPVFDPNTGEQIGEIDIETSNAIIEVTNDTNNKFPQINRYVNNPLLNPNGKQVILYAPNYSRFADNQFAAIGVPIIRSLKDLFDYLRGLP